MSHDQGCESSNNTSGSCYCHVRAWTNQNKNLESQLAAAKAEILSQINISSMFMNENARLREALEKIETECNCEMEREGEKWCSHQSIAKAALATDATNDNSI